MTLDLTHYEMLMMSLDVGAMAFLFVKMMVGR